MNDEEKRHRALNIIKDRIIMQSQTKHPMPDQCPEATHDTTLLDYIELLVNYKKMIGALTGAVFII